METAQNTAGQAEQTKTFRMVFMYRYTNDVGKAVTKWARTDQPNDGSTLDIEKANIWTFDSLRHMKRLYIGNIYEFEGVEREGGRVSITFVDNKPGEGEQWKNGNDVLEWSAIEYSKKATRGAEAKLKKTSQAWKAGLEPYKRVYFRIASGDEKAAYLAAVIQIITGRSK